MSGFFVPLGTVHTTTDGQTYVFSLIDQDIFGWKKVASPAEVIEVAEVADVIALMTQDFEVDDEDEEDDDFIEHDSPLSDDLRQQVRDAVANSLSQFTQNLPDPGDGSP